MSSTLQLAAFLGIALAVCAEASASEEIKAEFLRVYPHHAKKLRDYYSQGLWTARYTRQSSATQYADLSLKNSGDMFCFSATLRAGEAVIKPGHEVVCLRTPDGKVVDLDRLPDKKRYQLSEHATNLADARRMIHREMYPAVAAWSVQWEQVSDWLQQPTMKVLDVAEQTGGQHKLWKVEWEQPIEHPRFGAMRTWGWFTVRPEQHMVVESYEFCVGSVTNPFSHAFRAEIEYADAKNGQPPHVLGCRTWLEAGAERTRESGTTFSDVRFEPKQFSPQEFELAAFGIYDWQTPQRWVGGFALGGLAVALVGYVAVRRKQTDPSAKTASLPNEVRTSQN